MSGELRIGSPIPKYLHKLFSVFEQRRYLVGHIFYSANRSNWHLLYFDQRDISRRKNHWEAGSHIHVVNWLCVRSSAEEVWTEFNNGNPSLKGGFHIRWQGRRSEGPFGPRGGQGPN